uniref:SHC-transforming protein 1-like isoform X2 n=1 Tax=Myxine glutinosa TaxID=7769 RepID=UPI00358FE7CE
MDGSRYAGSGRGFGDPVEDWNRSGSFINKPMRGWLHPDELVLGPGVLYNVRYMGCIEVMKSMRALDFTTRTQVTREAICQICETCASLKGIPRKRKPTQQPLCSILGNRNMQFSGFNITLTISISSLNLKMPINKQIIANHHMQSISFASGGDQEMTDFVAYVAKDPVNHRACHILECEEGKAQDVICTIGQAFELRFKQYLGGPPRATPFSDRGTGRSWFEDDEKVDHDYYNSLPSKEAPPGGLVDLRLLEGPPHCGLDPTNEARRGSGGSQGRHPKEAFPDVGRRPSGPAGCAWDGSVIIRQSSLDDPMYVNTGPGVDASCPSSAQPRATSFTSALPLDDPLLFERWFHGRVSRQQVETMLRCDGDFLVRESTSTAGQFVLTGMHGGRAKHLLLVDPKGVVRTKDREFSNVSHLITYHRTNQLPIISSGSELCLRQPVERLAFD